jgi:bifunctional non-homologous end joining protein LigD
MACIGGAAFAMPRVVARRAGGAAKRPKAIRGEPLPKFIEPQLALLRDEAPAGEAWAHEIKLDGYRMHGRIDGQDVRLLTRTGLDWTERYRTIAAALGRLKARQAYIDGELCALDAKGLSSFTAMQAATDHRASDELVFFAFDLLHLDGEDFVRKPLLERKARLAELLGGAPDGLRYSEHFREPGPQVRAAACRIGAEGVVSKRIDQPYAPGNRGIWIKAKCLNRQEFVVVGWTEGEGSRKELGSLLLSYYAGRKLVYAGRVGSGITQREISDLRQRLEPLAVANMPLAAPPPRESRFGRPLELKRVHWVRPELVVEVTFLTWTADSLLRQVTFQGLREDKRRARCGSKGRRRRHDRV